MRSVEEGGVAFAESSDQRSSLALRASALETQTEKGSCLSLAQVETKPGIHIVDITPQVLWACLGWSALAGTAHHEWHCTAMARS